MTFERLLDISGDVEAFVKLERDKLALNIDRRLVNETPRDTGAARRNWLVSFNRTDDRQLPTGEQSQAISEGATNIDAAQAYGQLYIQNNLPYIQRLNEGSSKNAPARYIDSIIVQEVSRVN